MSDNRWKQIGDNIVGAVAIGFTGIFSPVLRYWYNRWGATESEVNRRLPGDERNLHPKLAYTRAITIHASPEQVWPWLVQLGQGKGGMYSYEGLENLIGCDLHNADQILPQFQKVQIGDALRLGPKGYPLYKIVAIEPNKMLLCAGADPKTEQSFDINAFDELPEEYTNGHWGFYLESYVDGSTRLIVRGRIDFNPTRMNWLIWRIITEPIGFVMERKMLLGIKTRAERLAAAQQNYQLTAA
jgi:hypothetical protein